MKLTSLSKILCKYLAPSLIMTRSSGCEKYPGKNSGGASGLVELMVMKPVLRGRRIAAFALKIDHFVGTTRS